MSAYIALIKKESRGLVAYGKKDIRAKSPEEALEKILEDERGLPGFQKFLKSVKVYSFLSFIIFGVKRRPLVFWLSVSEEESIERKTNQHHGVICPECGHTANYVSPPFGFESNTDDFKCPACEHITKKGPYTED